MTNLTERAEKALLGALLTDPVTIRQAGLAATGNFASRLHQQIHGALIARERSTYAGWAGSMSPNAAYARARGAAADSYLQELMDSCPDPSRAGVYARMVMEASLRRQLVHYALHSRYQAATMHHELNLLQELQPGGLDLPGLENAYPDPQRLFSHQLQISYALQANARAFDPAADTPAAATGADPAAAITVAGSVSASAGTPAWPSATMRHGAGPDWHAVNEERVIAGIIQQRAPADDVPAWLPAEAFGPGPRREIYAALTGICDRDDPVDPLILDWELARRHSAAAIQAPAQAPPLPDPRYVAHLSSIPIGTEVFLDACQDLLTSRTRSRQQPAAPATAYPVYGPARPPLPSPGRQQSPGPPAGSMTGPGHQPRM